MSRMPRGSIEAAAEHGKKAAGLKIAKWAALLALAIGSGYALH